MVFSPDGKRWVPSRPGFFLPVRPLAELFRGKFLARLRSAFERGEVYLPERLARLLDPQELRGFLSALYEKRWFVYSRAPFDGPAHVLRYLARYTHRVAISNRRLVSLENGTVAFRWRNYRGRRKRTMALSALEFLRRFLTHVLPSGFVRIRHFGFLSHRQRREKLEVCRRLLEPPCPCGTRVLIPRNRAADAPGPAARIRHGPSATRSSGA